MGISVLIVEDDREICALYEVVLKCHDISSVAVNTIQDAQNKLNTFIPTFIILDNSLPDGRGMDFINYIHYNYPCIKIIFCSADDFEVEFDRRELKVYSVLKKPFMLYNLHFLLQEITEIPICSRKVKCFPQECSNINYQI